MLSYLPEKVYENIKDNEYAKLADICSDKIFGHYDSFVQVLLDYVSENPIIQEIQEKTYTCVDDEYKKILDIMFDDNYVYIKDKFKDNYKELQLLAIYLAERGEIEFSDDFSERVNDFLNIYNTVEIQEVSSFIHIVAYTYYLYRLLLDIRSDGIYTMEEIDKWLNYENECWNTLSLKLEKCNESVKNIMYHKRIQMLETFFETTMVFTLKDDLTPINLVEEKMNIKDFKYNDFCWFKLIFNELVFQYCIDNADIDNAKTYLQNIINMMNWSFANKKYAIKSLNHFNKAFLDEYLYFIRIMYIVMERYMKKTFKLLNLNLLNDLDLRFIKGELSNDENEKVYAMMNRDTPYNIDWFQCNKSKLKYVDDIM